MKRNIIHDTMISVDKTKEDFTMEEWRDAEGFPKYEVSNYGNVRHKIKKKNLTGGLDTKGYRQVCLRDENDKQKTPKVHKLVARAFIPNPDNKPQVNHKDSDRTNAHVDNLEWVTNGENQKHAFDTGFQDNYGEKHPRTNLSEQDIIDIFLSKEKQVTLANRYGVHKSTISSIKHQRNFKQITDRVKENIHE